MIELEKLKREQVHRNLLLQLYRSVYKDIHDIEKTVARLLQLVLTALNVSDVALFVVDYASRNFICCTGRAR